MTLDPDYIIRAQLLNGTVVQLTLRELRQLIYGRNVAVLVISFLIAITASTPTLFPTLPEYGSRIFYWGQSSLLYLLLLPAWAYFFSHLWERLFGQPVPMVICTVPLVVGLTALATQLPMLLGDLVPPRGHSITWITFVKNCLLAQMMETAALVWLLPLNRQRARNAFQRIKATEDGPAQPRFVVLSGRSFPVEAIRKVRSAEHYLVVTTAQGTSEFRARMKDFVEQVTEDDGIQTHRSYWVSRDEPLKLDGSIIKTRSGEDIPVSRGRLPQVREWFARIGKPF